MLLVPTYSYACKDCDNRFDIQQAFSDDALTECPRCGGSVRKVFSSVGVVFKGSGFYRTDSRSAAGSNGSGPSKDGRDGKDGVGGKDGGEGKGGGGKVSEGVAAGSSGSSGESPGAAGGKESGARASGPKDARQDSPAASGSGTKGGDGGRRTSSTGSGKVARGA